MRSVAASLVSPSASVQPGGARFLVARYASVAGKRILSESLVRGVRRGCTRESTAPFTVTISLPPGREGANGRDTQLIERSRMSNSGQGLLAAEGMGPTSSFRAGRGEGARLGVRL